jgi:hypothetical protein
MQHQLFNGEVATQFSNPAVLSQQIRDKHGSDFTYVLQSSWNFQHTLAYGEKKLLKSGSFFEPGVADMLSLKIIKGTAKELKDPYSIMIAESVSKAYFGNDDPINKTLKLDNKADLKVTAVYEDLPLQHFFQGPQFYFTLGTLFNSKSMDKENGKSMG